MNNAFLVWLLNRLKERTTWGGIVAVITGVGVKISPELAESIISTGITVVGLIMTFTADPKVVVAAPVPGTDVTVPRDLKAELNAALAQGDYRTAASVAALLANQ